MIKIFPNILSSDRKEIGKQLTILQKKYPRLHLDIIDGKFADNKTLTLKQMAQFPQLKKIELLLHLMVDNPLQYLKEAAKIKTRYLVAQIEMMPDQNVFVKETRKIKIKSGLALDAGSTCKDIEKNLFPYLDIILVMTIKAGWSGCAFIKERLKEVKKLAWLKKKHNYSYKIAVDGGVNEKNIGLCAKAGAEIFFMYSAIWKSKNILKQIKYLRQLALLGLKK